jgi:hypothetical protein
MPPIRELAPESGVTIVACEHPTRGPKPACGDLPNDIGCRKMSSS